MNKQNIYPIVFICDNGYAMQTSVAITSIVKNKTNNLQYKIYVLGVELEEENIELVKSQKTSDVDIEVVNYQENKYKYLHENKNKKYMVANESALFKFEIAENLKDYEIALYMDSDIIVRKDLQEIFELDITEYYAAVVRDVPQVLYEKQLIDVGVGREYFNSGVMFLNLNKLRKEGMRDKLIAIKKDLNDSILMDQDVFNIAFKGAVLQLPLKFNFLYANLLNNPHKYTIDTLNKIMKCSYKTIDDAKIDSCVMHYASKKKPWKYFDVPGADEWLKYYLESPFRDNPIYRNSIDDETIYDTEEKKEIENVVPIVFATNNKYAPYLGVTVQSIIENCSREVKYSIYVLHTDMNRSNIDSLERVKRDNISIKCINIAKVFKSMPQSLYTCAHYSKEMYYRWFIPEIFSQYKFVLYLDCDLITLTDIKEIFDYADENSYISGIVNTSNEEMEIKIKRNFGLERRKYINSGVMLYNTRLCVTEEVKDRCFKTTANLKKEVLACPDQDVINVVCTNKITYIPDNWNVQWHHQWVDKALKNKKYYVEFEISMKKINIVHYTSGIKPWNHINRPLAEKFWEYARKSPFYEIILITYINNNAIKDDKKIMSNNLDYTKKIEQENELKKVYASASYRIGRSITFFPRKIRGGIRCFKENGLKYTFKRVGQKLRIKK